MYIFGLCGRSGSGKSTACGFLKEKGFYCIDADEVCHRIYETNEACIKELCDEFGENVAKDGKIDRSVLRLAIFEKDGGVDKLNAISHKYIIRDILTEANNAFKKGAGFVVIDAPTLYESGLHKHCDAIIALISKDEHLLSRLTKRDPLPKHILEKRLMTQKSNKDLFLKSSRVIVNNGTLLNLRKKIYMAIMLELIKFNALKLPKGGKRYALKRT